MELPDVQQKASRLYKKVLNLNSQGTRGARRRGRYANEKRVDYLGFRPI